MRRCQEESAETMNLTCKRDGRSDCPDNPAPTTGGFGWRCCGLLRLVDVDEYLGSARNFEPLKATHLATVLRIGHRFAASCTFVRCMGSRHDSSESGRLSMTSLDVLGVSTRGIGLKNAISTDYSGRIDATALPPKAGRFIMHDWYGDFELKGCVISMNITDILL